MTCVQKEGNGAMQIPRSLGRWISRPLDLWPSEREWSKPWARPRLADTAALRQAGRQRATSHKQRATSNERRSELEGRSEQHAE